MSFDSLAPFFADFGVTATWSPSAGGAMQSARVLLDSPDETYNIGITGATGVRRVMTYAVDALIGLKAAVDAGGIESVTINGVGYRVREVLAMDDGAMLNAKLGEWDRA